MSVVACLVLAFCCALIAGRYDGFQHIFCQIKRNRSFNGPYFQAMLFLVTMVLPLTLRTENNFK